MIRKYNNHKLQTTPWHREEEPLKSIPVLSSIVVSVQSIILEALIVVSVLSITLYLKFQTIKLCLQSIWLLPSIHFKTGRESELWLDLEQHINQHVAYQLMLQSNHLSSDNHHISNKLAHALMKCNKVHVTEEQVISQFRYQDPLIPSAATSFYM